MNHILVSSIVGARPVHDGAGNRSSTLRVQAHPPTARPFLVSPFSQDPIRVPRPLLSDPVAGRCPRCAGGAHRAEVRPRACDIHPTPSSGRQAAGRRAQAPGRPGGQGAGQARSRHGRPAQASRSCGHGVCARVRSRTLARDLTSPSPLISPPLANCTQARHAGGSGPGNQAGPGRQAGTTAGRQRQAKGAVGAVASGMCVL